jgi:hypothetical protein
MLKLLSLAAAAVSVGLLTAPASAAPIGDMKAGLQNGNSATQEVARRCHWDRGHRHCRYYGYGPGVSIDIGRGRRDRDGRRHSHGRGHDHHR